MKVSVWCAAEFIQGEVTAMGMHDVTIDDAAIDQGFAEFEAVDEKPGAAPVTGLAVQDQAQNEWAPVAKMLSQILTGQVCPNWQVPDDTRQEWADALAGCLDQLFPGGLGNIANWGPWAKLAYSSGLLVMCGVDFSTMTLKPLRAPVEGEAEEVAEPDGAVSVPMGQGAASAGRHMMG